jgi:hypothetical protein
MSIENMVCESGGVSIAFAVDAGKIPEFNHFSSQIPKQFVDLFDLGRVSSAPLVGFPQPATKLHRQMRISAT